MSDDILQFDLERPQKKPQKYSSESEWKTLFVNKKILLLSDRTKTLKLAESLLNL